MDCTKCSNKNCRSLKDCSAHSLDREAIIQSYNKQQNQAVVQAAGLLVDNGRAGMLSRLQELIEFAQNMKYKKIGLAYCYGMEKDALAITDIIKGSGLNITAVSCTVGSIPQKAVNQTSDLPGVSCNPIGQAEQLNNEKVDFTIIVGLCLGHDILFHRYIKGDFTTLVVKDRVHDHQPLKGVNAKN